MPYKELILRIYEKLQVETNQERIDTYELQLAVLMQLQELVTKVETLVSVMVETD